MEVAAATLVAYVYGIVYGYWDEPVVVYSSEQEARGVLIALGLPGVVVRKSYLETDWEVVL